jgi:RNA polymerase sigma-70 factor (sigma-E family)
MSDVDGFERLESLYRDHATTLLRLAVLMIGESGSAEEVLHEAFLRFHDRGRAESGSELAYLRRTVINLCNNQHRHRRVVETASVPRAGEVPEPAVTAVRSMTRGRVVEAVRRLPARQRECVVLHYFEQLTDREIGEALGISAGSVKTHLHRARERLRLDLERLT